MDPKLERALRRFRKDIFTDNDVSRCTGLSPRSVRELIKFGAVRTRSEDRGAGHIRTFDSTMFKRLAVISAVHEASFNLQVAGRVARVLPSADLLYRTHDPISALCETAGPGQDRDYPPRAVRAKWFKPDEPAAVDAEYDWLLEIFDRRFVALVAQGKRVRMVYGDLRNDGTKFVSWGSIHALSVSAATGDGRKPGTQGSTSDQVDARSVELGSEEREDPDEALVLEASAAKWRPISTMSINASLAIRLAVRRYLDIESLSAESPEAMRIRIAKIATSSARLR